MAEQIAIPDSFAPAGDVTGRWVVLTGAGRGFGQLLAHAFSVAGSHVALVARIERQLAEVAALLPGRSLVFSGDRRPHGAATLGAAPVTCPGPTLSSPRTPRAA